MNVALSFIFNCPLIAYFLKKNYSLRQNSFEKFEGLREVTYISPNWCLFGSYWSWDLIGNRQHEGLWRFARKRVIGRCTGLWSPASNQFTGGELLLRRSDHMLKQCFPSVRSDGDPASGHSFSAAIHLLWTDRTLDIRVRCSVRSLFLQQIFKDLRAACF